MTFRGWQAIPAVTIVAVLTGLAWGELTPEQTKQAQALIKQCGDKDFKLREEASRKLVEMGGDVLTLVEEATQATEDAEVKMRCRAVVDALKEQAELKTMEPSKVTLDVQDEPLEEVLKELARQSGNSEMKAQETLNARKVTVKVKDVPYWQAVNAVCASAGACYEGTDRGAGVWEIGLAPRPGQMVDMGTIAGPAMVIVGGVKRNNSSYADLHGTGGKPDLSVLTFYAQVFMEDRLPITRIALNLTNVTAADGLNRGRGVVQGQGSTISGGLSGRVGGYWTKVGWWESPTEWPTGAVTLEGTLELSYGLHPKELRVEKVFESNGAEVSADGRKLTLKQAERHDELVTLMLVLDDPANQATDDMAQGARWGLFLVDPEGKRHASKEGFLNPQGKAVEGRLSFPNVPNLRGDWTLIYAYPEKEAKASYPFTIQGVPAP